MHALHPSHRDELVRAAEWRALYAALWDRPVADELRAVLPPEAFAGRAALVWALVCHHDAASDPWPGVDPDTTSWSGPGRVLSVLAAALRLDVPAPAARLDGGAATMRQARRVGVGEHALALAAVEPAAGWTLTLDQTVRVLCLAPAYRAAADALAQLDALAASALPPSATAHPGRDRVRVA